MEWGHCESKHVAINSSSRSFYVIIILCQELSLWLQSWIIMPCRLVWNYACTHILQSHGHVTSCIYQFNVKYVEFMQFVPYTVRNNVIHTCMHTYVHTYIHACMHTYVHTYIHTYIHSYIHTCTYVVVYTCSIYVVYTYVYMWMYHKPACCTIYHIVKIASVINQITRQESVTRGLATAQMNLLRMAELMPRSKPA